MDMTETLECWQMTGTHRDGWDGGRHNLAADNGTRDPRIGHVGRRASRADRVTVP